MTSNSPDSANTHDLAKDLAASDVGKGLNLSVARSQEIILTMVDSIAARLARHETVRVHNLGNFKVLPTKARRGKNPKTQEEITIEAGFRVHLAVSQFLKDSAADKKVPTRESRKAAAPAVKRTPPPQRKGAPAQAAAAKQAAPKKGGGFRPPTSPAASDDV